MHSRTPALLLGLTTCLVAVGCSTSTSEGKPLPVPTSETSSASEDVDPGERELPYAGAPAVDNSLETDRYQQDPCKALTETQAQELNLNFPGELQDGALGDSCRFGGRTDARARVVVSSFGEYPYGLSAAYKANEDGKFAFFEALPAIEGFPAVAWAEIDDRPNGGCRVEFGTSDEIAFDVAVLLAQEFVGVKDPCESAVLVAGEVIRTMKATP